MLERTKPPAATCCLQGHIARAPTCFTKPTLSWGEGGNGQEYPVWIVGVDLPIWTSSVAVPPAEGPGVPSGRIKMKLGIDAQTAQNRSK